MVSKLEYWFLLTEIAVVVLDVLKMASTSASQLTTRGGSCGMDCEIVLPTFSNPSIFRSPISNAGLDFGFSNSPKVPPDRPKYYFRGNWKIQKSANCQKFSEFIRKSPNFQSPKIIQPER